MDVKELLIKVRDGAVSPEEAERILKFKPFEDTGFARLDTHRGLRQSFPEVVFCSGKKTAYLTDIFERLYAHNGEVLGTRASREQYEAVRARLPEVRFEEESGLLIIDDPEKKRTGKVTVCTAGTADIPVAKEAAGTAEFFGARVETVFDVGVSGLHRLLDALPGISDSSCVIAVAGMEGALAGVLGGLVDCPVIAVPTSVGYGASFGGLSALLTMINSCSNSVAVVNIDNGYGAGCIAARINRQTAGT